MTTTVQWRITNAAGVCVANGMTASITLNMGATGILSHQGTPITGEVHIYFIGGTTAAFTIVVEDNDPRIHSVVHSIDTPQTEYIPKTGGCRWSQTGTDKLEIVFDAPDDDAAITWDFDSQVPGVALAVRVKRQGNANAAGDCDEWP